MRRIVVSLLLMVGSILATAAKVLPMTFAHDGATDNLTGAGQAYYALTDHLGSYTRLYTMAGDSVLIASYDPWGNRTTTKNTLKFFDERSDRGRYHRGFTGHEHLTTYGVINMRSAQRDALLAKNGRMYDPTVGRYLAPRLGIWLSPDPMQLKYPHVSSYAYCMGNLVKLTDLFGLAPGDFFRTVNAAAVDFGLFYNYNSISASSKEMVDDIIRDSLRQAQEPSATSSGTIGDRLRNHLRYLFRLSLIDVQRPQKKSCKERGNTSPKCAESSCLSDFPMVR